MDCEKPFSPTGKNTGHLDKQSRLGPSSINILSGFVLLGVQGVCVCVCAHPCQGSVDLALGQGFPTYCPFKAGVETFSGPVAMVPITSGLPVLQPPPSPMKGR